MPDVLNNYGINPQIEGTTSGFDRKTNLLNQFIGYLNRIGAPQNTVTAFTSQYGGNPAKLSDLTRAYTAFADSSLSRFMRCLQPPEASNIQHNRSQSQHPLDRSAVESFYHDRKHSHSLNRCRRYSRWLPHLQAGQRFSRQCGAGFACYELNDRHRGPASIRVEWRSVRRRVRNFLE